MNKDAQIIVALGIAAFLVCAGMGSCCCYFLDIGTAARTKAQPTQTEKP